MRIVIKPEKIENYPKKLIITADDDTEQVSAAVIDNFSITKRIINANIYNGEIARELFEALDTDNFLVCGFDLGQVAFLLEDCNEELFEFIVGKPAFDFMNRGFDSIEDIAHHFGIEAEHDVDVLAYGYLFFLAKHFASLCDMLPQQVIRKGD